MNSLYTWTSACIYRETEDSVCIVFNTGATRFQYKAGQFIELTLYCIMNKPVTRAYSLCSTAGEDESPAITVKRIEGGLMSNYILNHAEEITEWKVSGPHGSFYVDALAGDKQWNVFIGAGSGITVLFSMIKYLLINHNTNILLINANKSSHTMLFRKVLTYLENCFSNRFTMISVFSQEMPENTEGLNKTISGRLSSIRLKKILKQQLQQELLPANYYICGPEGFIEMSVNSLENLGVSNSQINKEYFFITEPADLPVLPDTVSDVLLHFREQSNLLSVAPEKTILDMALEDYIGISYSCKNGSCGKCVGKLLQGKIYMKRNHALSQEQVAQGLILLCQSYPTNNDVTIEVF